MKKIDLAKIKKVYFIGIKGSGMIAFVEIFRKRGVETVGSDVEEKFFTDETLRDLGVDFYEGFSAENIKKEKNIDLAVYSTAYSQENNPEVEYVFEKGIPHFSYPELIGEFTKQKYAIAVCGTHGKTTTSAMLALAMKDAGADPSAIIGSKVKQIGSNAMAGRSEYFVIEADEYQNKLVLYDPDAVILTGIDYDHPDFFASFEDYKKVFEEFVKRIPEEGFLVANGADEDVVEIAKQAKCKVVFYAQRPKDFSDSRHTFVEAPLEMKLSVPGKHNVENATAVFAVCAELGLDEKKVVDSLNAYGGTARRFEVLGNYKGAVVVDDYAHHPKEVSATLAAAREKYFGRRIVCVFHPHTFSRTKALLDEFGNCFTDADEVVILDIYASARERGGKIHSKDLVEKISQAGKKVRYVSTLGEVVEQLKEELGGNDLLITMGAGNVNEIAHELVKSENEK